jgi:hypothetical protein
LDETAEVKEEDVRNEANVAVPIQKLYFSLV